MGLFDGLAKYGIGELDAGNLYKKAPEEKESDTEDVKNDENSISKVNEKEYLHEKSYVCPICTFLFKELLAKNPRIKVVKYTKNLRPVYEPIEPIKYEVVSCPMCGYTVMSKYFGEVPEKNKKRFIEKIGREYPGNKYYQPEVLDYDCAIERFELAVATAMVTNVIDSEKAYICLKGKWLCESYMDYIEADIQSGIAEDELKKLKFMITEKGKEFLNLAYEGFIMARQNENFPIAGMDQTTLDYLIAALASELGKYEVASKLISSILQNRAVSARIKDKARALKDEMIEVLKNRDK